MERVTKRIIAPWWLGDFEGENLLTYVADNLL